MPKIYVDGDACPVKPEISRVAERYALQVYLVSNKGLRPEAGSKTIGIVVGSEFDAADNWIAENVVEDDIVITADIQLAARCLKKSAVVLGPNGKGFTAGNIGSALAMRELNAYLRDTGEIKGANAAFSKADRSQFLQSLDEAIQQLRKKTNNASL